MQSNIAISNPNDNVEGPLHGEILPPEMNSTGPLARVRGALTAGYALAGTVGARRVQLQMLDGLTALKVLS